MVVAPIICRNMLGDLLTPDVHILLHVMLVIRINSLEHIPLSEANSSSISQDFHHISWNRVQKNTSFVPVVVMSTYSHLISLK
jgi:hypothetical protein